MRKGVALLSPAHLAIIAAIPLLAALLARVGSRSSAASNAVRTGLALFLLLDELIWYAYAIRVGGFRFPDELPLQLSDFIVWSTIVAALTGNRRFFEFSYFVGIAGSGMAILTPDLFAAGLSFPVIHFFLAHGISIVTVLAMLWMKTARIARGAMWRAFFALNAIALAIGIFDAAFRTNYMFFRAKPTHVSLLTFFGPWPVYILLGDLIALGLFYLLELPFRRDAAQ